MGFSAEAQFQTMVKQAVRDGHVFTFLDDGFRLVFSVGGHEAIPFWSSRNRMIAIHRRQPEYQQYAIEELGLSEFEALLHQMETEGLRVGCNWSGPLLRGFDLDPGSVLSWLAYYRENGPDAPKFPRGAPRLDPFQKPLDSDGILDTA